jgi:hypothetical protein
MYFLTVSVEAFPVVAQKKLGFHKVGIFSKKSKINEPVVQQKSCRNQKRSSTELLGFGTSCIV